MKKRILTAALVMIMIIGGCGGGNSDNNSEKDHDKSNIENKQEQESDAEVEREVTTEAIIDAFKNGITTVGDAIVYTEETDVNELLGRPNQYTGKADFSDTRAEQGGEYLVGGTVETFNSKEDCDSRWNYLKQFDSADAGALGLKQYVYKYEKVLLRIDYALTPSQAEEYRNIMNEYLNEEPEQNY